MRTIVIDKTENSQCKKFARVRGHSVATYSSAVVNRSDFLNSEWEITYSRVNSANGSGKMLKTAAINANDLICEENDGAYTGLDVSDEIRKVLVDEAKRNIRILSLFTAEPLISKLPYETIEHFRRLIAGFKLTLGHLENG